MINPNIEAFNLEILISTMNRSSLSFLDDMFFNNQGKDYNILIINQTSPDNLLISEIEKIRVVNTFEKGLPASRNLALKHALGDICLIADDDVIYAKDFEKSILESYQENERAEMITFQMEDDEGNLFRDYPNKTKHDKKSISTANSVVISFFLKAVKNKGVKFDEHFGIGSTFQTANEYVFLRNALSANLQIYYQPKVILSHPKMSSGQDAGSDRIVYARGALFYKYSGYLGYIRILKYLYLVWRKGEIEANEFYNKVSMGFKGIRDFKGLEKK